MDAAKALTQQRLDMSLMQISGEQNNWVHVALRSIASKSHGHMSNPSAKPLGQEV